jgi:hypothetical protein
VFSCARAHPLAAPRHISPSLPCCSLRWCYPRASREQWNNFSKTHPTSLATMRAGPGEQPLDKQEEEAKELDATARRKQQVGCCLVSKTCLR